MEDVNLFKVCMNAFVAVLGLLSLLAAAMRVLIAVFPEKPATPATDSAVVAAIQLAVHQAVPGGHVSRIEPLK